MCQYTAFGRQKMFFYLVTVLNSFKLPIRKLIITAKENIPKTSQTCMGGEPRKIGCSCNIVMIYLAHCFWWECNMHKWHMPWKAIFQVVKKNLLDDIRGPRDMVRKMTAYQIILYSKIQMFYALLPPVQDFIIHHKKPSKDENTSYFHQTWSQETWLENSSISINSSGRKETSQTKSKYWLGMLRLFQHCDS